MTTENINRIKRVVRREGYRMTRESRALLIRSILETHQYFIPMRQDKKHRRIYGYDRVPVAFSVRGHYYVVAENGTCALEQRKNGGFTNAS